MDSDSQITFFGHFELGERLSITQRATASVAHTSNSTLAVLIGDIGFRDKLWAYVRNGMAGVQELYANRRALCAGRACVAMQVLGIDEARDRIDEEQLDLATEILRSAAPAAFSALGAIDRETLKTNGIYDTLARVVRDMITPSLVKRQLQLYGLADDVALRAVSGAVSPARGVVNYFSEQQLLNVAHRRLRASLTNSPLSWRRMPQVSIDSTKPEVVYVAWEQLTSERGVPLCRAIMLALYEQLGLAGIRHVVEHYDERVAFALIGAQSLMRVVGTDCHRWPRAITTTLYRTEGDHIVSSPLPWDPQGLATIAQRYQQLDPSGGTNGRLA